MTDTAATIPFQLPAWAHTAGVLNLTDAKAPASSDEVAARLLITERIARYCWAYDERRADLLGDCFTQDATWEGTVLGQIPIGPFTGRDTIMRWLSEFWPHQKDQRRHMILNTIVQEQDAHSATTLSYLLLMASTGEAMSMESMGFYRVNYRIEDGQWRIAHLFAGFDKPFWPGKIENLSNRGRARHGITEEA
ncbi:MAG: nuclear transport factor 2 family protein [Novosphingobium sp.]